MEPSYITQPALETIEYDVLFMESCCKKIKDQSIDSFVELKQLIAYGRSEKYEDIANRQLKAKKYTRVDIKDAILLLEKLKNFDTSWFYSLSSDNKQYKLNIENAIKLLKEIK